MTVRPVIAADRFDARAVRVNGHDLANARGEDRFKQNPSIAQHAVRKYRRRAIADPLRIPAIEPHGLDPSAATRVNDPVVRQIEGANAIAAAGSDLTRRGAVAGNLEDLPWLGGRALSSEQNACAIEGNFGVRGSSEPGRQRASAGQKADGCPTGEALSAPGPRRGVVLRRFDVCDRVVCNRRRARGNEAGQTHESRETEDRLSHETPEAAITRPWRRRGSPRVRQGTARCRPSFVRTGRN